MSCEHFKTNAIVTEYKVMFEKKPIIKNGNGKCSRTSLLSSCKIETDVTLTRE